MVEQEKRTYWPDASEMSERARAIWYDQLDPQAFANEWQSVDEDTEVKRLEPTDRLRSLRLRFSGETTRELYKQPDGSWDPNRRAFHDALVELYLAGKPRKENPLLYIVAGGLGVGKSTVARKVAPEHPDAVWLDPDFFRPVLPEYKLLEATDLDNADARVQEEIAVIAAKAFARAIRRRLDVLLETCLCSPETLEMLRKVKQAGYLIHLDFVDALPEVAVERVQKRFARRRQAQLGCCLLGSRSGLAGITRYTDLKDICINRLTPDQKERGQRRKKERMT